MFFNFTVALAFTVLLGVIAVQWAPRCEAGTPTVKIGGAILVAGC